MTTFAERKARARELRRKAPGYGTCYRCDTPWCFTESHSTTYDRKFPPRQGREPMRSTSSSGMFPLCEDCWQELDSAQARLPYYEALAQTWANAGYPDRLLTREHLLEVLEIEAGPPRPIVIECEFGAMWVDA